MSPGMSSVESYNVNSVDAQGLQKCLQVGQPTKDTSTDQENGLNTSADNNTMKSKHKARQAAGLRYFLLIDIYYSKFSEMLLSRST